VLGAFLFLSFRLIISKRIPKTGKPRDDKFPKRDQQHPLDYKIVIVDEYAMVNHELHRNLINALPRGGCIRTFGDVQQLTPIEKNKYYQDKPSPFQDILANFNGVVLETLHRTGDGSGIVKAADSILKGRIPLPNDDFRRSITNNLSDKLQEVVAESLTRGTDFSKIENQVICPSKRTKVGTAKLNALLQNIFRPEKEGWLDLPRHSWDENKQLYCRIHAGDKVMITSNSYGIECSDGTKGVFNGETGTVVEILEDTGEVIIDLGDRVCNFPPHVHVLKPNGDMITVDPRKDLDLAYCITTHKSQGSEYKHVIYVISRSSGMLLGRHNFYTAVIISPLGLSTCT
jgi:exodeoxyribonuclease V alpha subunit